MEINSLPKNTLQGLGENWVNVYHPLGRWGQMLGVRLPVKVVTHYASLLWPQHTIESTY